MCEKKYLNVWEMDACGVTVTHREKTSRIICDHVAFRAWQDTDTSLQVVGESLIKTLFSKMWVGLRKVTKG